MGGKLCVDESSPFTHDADHNGAYKSQGPNYPRLPCQDEKYDHVIVIVRAGIVDVCVSRLVEVEVDGPSSIRALLNIYYVLCKEL